MSGTQQRHLRWPLDATTELADGILVVALSGRISGRSSTALAALLSSRIDGGLRGVVLDVAGVDYISSAGLEVIDAAAARLAREGGSLVLAAVAEPVRIALDLAGLLARLPIEPSRERALARIRTP